MQVPRYWRERGFRYDPKGEKCSNCGEVEIQIRRPVCKGCGIEFRPERTDREGVMEIRTHRVIGRKMRVYLTDELPESERPMPVTLPVKTRQQQEV